jgi:hypothetical protein
MIMCQIRKIIENSIPNARLIVISKKFEIIPFLPITLETAANCEDNLATMVTM